MNPRKLIPSWLRANHSAANLPGGEPDKLNLNLPMEIVEAAADGGDGSGDGTGGGGKKLPRFNITGYTGGVMRVAGFFHPVVVDLKGLKAAKVVKILREHDPARIVGHADADGVEITAKRVKVSGVISGAGPDAQEILATSKNGFPWEASLGVPIERLEFVDSSSKVVVNGATVEGPAYVVRAGTLQEVSVVAFGADSNTSTSIAAGLKGQDMNFEQWLKAKGIENITALPAPVQAQLKAAFEAEQKATASAAGDDGAKKPADAGAANANPAATLNASAADVQKLVTDAVAAAVTAAQQQWQKDQEKRAQILTLTASHPEIQKKAIAENWSIEKAELEVFRASRPQIGALYINAGAGQEDVAPTRVLEAALCQSGNLNKIDKAFDDKTLQAAHNRFRGRLGLKQFLLEAAWAGGYMGSHFDTSASGMQSILKAAFSTISLPGILSNVANKFLLDSFMSVESTWRDISAIRTVTDFKQVTSYRMTGNFEFVEIGASGELEHGELGEESFNNQARTYGIMLTITRQMIINDDLGAFMQVLKMIGRGSAIKFNSVFWTAFMDNAAFFSADNGNYFEGASSALSIDSLTTAEQKFLDQTDANGNPLGVMPELLLVPNALSTKSANIFNSTELRDTTASTKFPTSNPHAGKYRPVRSSYLSNANISGNSTTAWYLLANPATLATIESCFLNGVQQPTLETADADFNVLGIQMRGYLDFGVSKQEYRAGVKSKGAV